MTPLLRIRLEIFAESQAAMAAIAGVDQGTWSRWERGHLEPTLGQLMRIRAEARRRKLKLDDRSFFEGAG